MTVIHTEGEWQRYRAPGEVWVPECQCWACWQSMGPSADPRRRESTPSRRIGDAMTTSVDDAFVTRTCARCGHVGAAPARWRPRVYDYRRRCGWLSAPEEVTVQPERFDRACTRCHYAWVEPVVGASGRGVWIMQTTDHLLPPDPARRSDITSGP